MTRLLVIMGSGETAPTMIKTHRQVFERLAGVPGPAVLVDTPYGFQANADDISARALTYFSASVGTQVEVAELRSATGDPVAQARALARIANARWVFAGPGSPSYALRQWRDTEMQDLLVDKLAHDGAVVFASAAALTLGRLTVPVYEIYKVGADPVWLDGLDLLGFLGPEVAVVPHYDNAEGGNHDTRFCYLGESRLALLESRMGAEGWVLGVDEHTACVLDLEASTATVTGTGTVTVRRRGCSSVIDSGLTVSFDELIGMALSSPRSDGSSARPAPGAGGGGGGVGVGVGGVMVGSPAGGGGGGGVGSAAGGGRAPTALHAEIRQHEADFDAAITRSDVDGAVRALLALDDTLFAWSGDSTQSDAGERGRAAMRRMIARLGDLAMTGARDPREAVAAFVDALLAERAAARRDKRYADSDRIRDALVAAGVEVRDTPDGTVWDLAPAGDRA